MFVDSVQKECIKDDDENQGQENQKNAVKPEEVVSEQLGICKVSAVVGPVAFCFVVLKSKDWSGVEKLRNLNKESNNVDEDYHDNVLPEGKCFSMNDKKKSVDGYSSNNPD